MTIKIICAWCQREMGEKEGDAPNPVSHSICSACKKMVLTEIDSIPHTKDSHNKHDERRTQYER